MENQGFEEEQQPRIEEGAIFPRRSSDSFPFRPSTRLDDASSTAFVANADGHVYEDILPGAADVSNPSDPSSTKDARGSRTNHLQRSFNAIDRVSREGAIGSLDRGEISSPFRRNLTLPFRRGTVHDSSSTASSSVRATTSRKGNEISCQNEAEIASGGTVRVDDSITSREIAARTQSTALQIECRPNRRRRKKDCKHCRNKAAASTNAREREVNDWENEAILRKNNEQRQQHLYVTDSNRPKTNVDSGNFNAPAACSPTRKAEECVGTGHDSSSVFTISEKVAASPASTLKFIEYERNDGRSKFGNSIENKEGDNGLIASEKNRAGMRVNSIYSQDRWYAKEVPIFFTDVKEQGPFQRAYSLPLRTQTPSSQNRINLRRSVRGEPPPQPARLRKHRHGWTLHLAHPLETSGCTRSLVLLLILILALLGIGAIALYVALEPEKLQIIQQYLKSSNGNTLVAGTFVHDANTRKRNDTSTTSATPTTTTTTTTLASSTLIASSFSNGNQSFPGSGTPLETETEATSPSNLNSTRYCDDCLAEEVCVALVDEEVPICRIGLDPEDPTGCAGFCLVNKQKCHRLDVDAFRCVDIEHYCLDDEWTCSNTLCIPLEKRCDGHMNCYDHSDEHNCVCDPETHFQCGNETSCLPLEKRCDGKIDCWDAADEINCTLACPSENEFTCSNGQCILKARFCDGLPDCIDGSDEPHGCQGRCNKHEFTCQNNRCITKGMKCNGIDDCGDGTDERHCKDRVS